MAERDAQVHQQRGEGRDEGEDAGHGAVRVGEDALQCDEADDQGKDEEQVELLQLMLGVGHGPEGGGDRGVEGVAEDEIDEEIDDLRGGESDVDALAAEIGGDGTGGEEQGGGEPDADLGDADRANPEDLSGHHLLWADGGEHDLEDARSLLLDDGAGNVHAVERDDHVHEDEEDGDAHLGGLAVVAVRGVGGEDVDGLEHGVGVVGDDATVGKLLSHEDSAEGGGQLASQVILFD